MSRAVTPHTPGPWIVERVRAFEHPVRIREHFAVRNASGPTFAYLPEGRADIQQSNARLIAAAPDLLAALHQCAELLEGLPECGYVHRDSMEPIAYSPDGALAAARAALAAATTPNPKGA